MQEQSTTTGPRLVTQSHNPWTDEERAIITAIAPRKPTKRELRALFPGRSLGAIKTRLSLERKRQGLSSPCRSPVHLKPQAMCLTMLDRDDPGIAGFSWQTSQRAAAERANAAFLASLRVALAA